MKNGLNKTLVAAAVSLGLVSGCSGSDNQEQTAPPANTAGSAGAAGAAGAAGNAGAAGSETDAGPVDCDTMCKKDDRTTVIINDGTGVDKLAIQGKTVKLTVDNVEGEYKVDVNGDSNKVTLSKGDVTISLSNQAEKETNPSMLENSATKDTKPVTLYIPVVDGVEARSDTNDNNSKGSVTLNLELKSGVAQPTRSIIYDGETAVLPGAGNDKLTVKNELTTKDGTFLTISYQLGSATGVPTMYYLKKDKFYGFETGADKVDQVKVTANATSDVINDNCRVFEFTVNLGGQDIPLKNGWSVATDSTSTTKLSLDKYTATDDKDSFVSLTVKSGSMTTSTQVLSEKLGNTDTVGSKAVKLKSYDGAENVCVGPDAKLDKDSLSKYAVLVKMHTKACEARANQSVGPKVAKQG